ncbi:MAG: hypothetical protein JHC33_12075 [Ignisphaera sp.]|nr:hypothetical protein [Ignisphaera sp.]
MKIILINEEAHQYMDMRYDIAEYKERITELSEAIETLQLRIVAYEQFPLEHSGATHTEEYADTMGATLPTDTTIEEIINEEEKPLSIWNLSDWISYVSAKEYPEDRKGAAWIDGEDHIVHMAVGKAHDAFKITSIAKALGRTVGAINSRAIKSGFSVRKNRIVNL